MEIGTKVTCPECRLLLMVCIKPPERGSDKYVDCFEYHAFRGEVGDKTICPRCAAKFWNENGVHTDSGWSW